MGGTASNRGLEVTIVDNSSYIIKVHLASYSLLEANRKANVALDVTFQKPGMIIPKRHA
jgi:hypothetical protein